MRERTVNCNPEQEISAAVYSGGPGNRLDHLNAVKTLAAERYLLGELPATEAEEFELHYFDCTECATAVEAGQQFVANARKVWEDDERLAEPSRMTRERSWLPDFLRLGWMRPAFPMATLLVLLSGTITLYELGRRPRGGGITVPAVMMNTIKLQDLERGASSAQGPAGVFGVPAGATILPFSLLEVAEDRETKYICDLYFGGEDVYKADCPALNGDGSVEWDVLIAATGRKSGSYRVGVTGPAAQGQPAAEIFKAQFKLQFQK